ncbi:autotransporter domain-containing protein [Halopseudomonas pelagia]|uniref:autotransporter domain-containing protein n=1 Tax=Halopseudomonas pelagia TaxID=553151 RepID=UPI0030DC2714
MIKPLVVLVSIASGVLSLPVFAYQYGEYGTETTFTLINDYPGRYRGTANFDGAANLMEERMAPGYTTSRQAFTWTAGGTQRSSENVIATASGVTGRNLVIGSHFDTVFNRPTLEGLDDNASGAGVLTEIARNLSGLDFEDGVTFIGFGAEEEGLRGSRAYVASLDQQARDNLTGMINIDSLITGDMMYAHAGTNSVGNTELASLREHVFRIASELGIDLFTNPGLNAGYPIGTGCCSDGDSFNEALDIPVLYFESTNWEIGDFDGYEQTTNPAVPGGSTWHNPATDNAEFLIGVLGEERVAQRMRDYSRLITRLVLEATNTDLRYSAQSGASLARDMQDNLVRQHQTLTQLHDRRWLSLLGGAREVGSFDGAVGIEGEVQPSGGFDQSAIERGRHAAAYILADYQFTEALNLGVSLSYQRAKDERDYGGDLQNKTWQAGIYAQLHDGGPTWLNAELSVGRSDLESTRALHIQADGGPVLLSQRFDGETDASFYGARLLGGYDFNLGQVRVGPMVGADYTRYSVDSFSEKGDLRTALDYGSEKFDSIELSLGARAFGAVALSKGMLLQPYASLVWVEEVGDGLSDSFQFVSRGDGLVRGAEGLPGADKHFARVKVGAQLAVSANFGVFAETTARAAHDDGDQSGYAVGAQLLF